MSLNRIADTSYPDIERHRVDVLAGPSKLNPGSAVEAFAHDV